MSTSTIREKTPAKVSVPSSSIPISKPRPRSWLRDVLPNLIVIAALVSLASWGYLTDWKIPKFSTLVATSEAKTEAWCEDHNVPESQCIECNKSLAPPGTNYGWCRVHGVMNCPLEHPDVAELSTVPLQNPDLVAKASHALEVRPRAENNSRCTLHEKRIQFASTNAIDKAGIDIAIVEQRPLVEAISANGEVHYDETQMARLSSRVAGTVWLVQKRVGDQVKRGEILAVIDAASVGQAKSEFLKSITSLRLKKATTERLRPLATDGAIAGRSLREAESAFEEARIEFRSCQQTLSNLGFDIQGEELADRDVEDIAKQVQLAGLPDEVISRLGTHSNTSNLYPLRASLDGEVIERNVVEGELVDPSKPLFGIADLTHLWLTLSVRQEDAPYLSLGQKVLFRASSGLNDRQVEGTVNWISSATDDVTRTLKVRAELPNESRSLRANTFGMGSIVLRDEPKAFVVPSEAVHWDGSCHIVFVRDKNFHKEGSPKFFHVRCVRLGVVDGSNTEIIAGVLPGEVIASKNSMILEAQLLKSNLGAGCACCAGPAKSKEKE